MRKSVLAGLVTALCVCGAAVAADAPAGVDAFTKPSKDVTLSFIRPGKVAKILVERGQEVKQGQLLAQLDDQVELVQLAQLKAQAEDQTRIKAAQAQLAQRKVDLQKFEEAAHSRAATALEVEHARLDVTIAELSLDLAQFEHGQDQRKYEEAKLQIERMRLTSPTPGRVHEVHIKEGESVNALDKVFRLVRTDPLWIDAPVRTSDAQKLGLSVGRQVQVEFPSIEDGASRGPLASGTIKDVSAVGDPGSDTLIVWVEVPNEKLRPAGERVKVRFERVTAAAGAAGTDPSKTSN